MAGVRASAFSVLLLFCAAPYVPSGGALLPSWRWAFRCHHAACPSVATGPTRPPLPRVRPPSRRPPSQGKWGPLGCSPPDVLWAWRRHSSSSPLQSLCPGARRGVLWSRPPSLRALANASPTLESAPALPAAALPREVAAKAPPTHLYPEPPPPSVSPGLTASSPPTAPASGRAMVPPLASWRCLPWRWSPVALALAAFFSLEALQSGRGRRPPTKTRQAGAPNAGQKKDKDKGAKHRCLHSGVGLGWRALRRH
jgi:hypothetical protein